MPIKRDLYSITPIDFPHHLNTDDEKLIEGHFLYERPLCNSIFMLRCCLSLIFITGSIDLSFSPKCYLKTIITS